MSQPLAFAEFSDDIRYEIGGKTSVIGIYAGQLNVLTPTMPDKLPRLGVSVAIVWPTLDDLEPVTVQIFFPGQPDEPAFESAMDPRETNHLAPDYPGRRPALIMRGILEQVPIVAGGAFEVWVGTAAGRTRAGYLMVRHTPQPEIAEAAMPAGSPLP